MLVSMNTQRVKGPTQQRLLLASSYSLQLGEGGLFPYPSLPHSPAGYYPAVGAKILKILGETR